MATGCSENPPRSIHARTVVLITIFLQLGLSIFYWMFSFRFADDAPLCIALGIFSLMSTVAMIGTFLSSRELSIGFQFASLVCHGAAVVVALGAIYYGYGIVSSTTPAKDVTAGAAIYFSIVTLTTLGYGDFYPPSEIQMLAAIQALVGYVYLGLVVAISSVALRAGSR